MRLRKLFACLVTLVVAMSLPQPIAGQLRSRPAEEWTKSLAAPSRVEGLQVDDIIARLRLKSGDVIADLGAGPGVFSLPLAEAVSPSGKVYAVEIDQGFLDIISQKAVEQRIANVEVVLGKFADPSLPAADVDVAFFHDVLHHIQDRAGYLKNLARYVKPAGRVVIIDLTPEGSPHQEQPDLVVTRDQATAWMADTGFKPVEEITDLFTDKWFVVYSR